MKTSATTVNCVVKSNEAKNNEVKISEINNNMTSDNAMDSAQKDENNAANDPAVRQVPSPRQLKHELALSDELVMQIDQQRQQVRDVLNGQDDRLLIVTGPCSLHDEKAALDYGKRLAQLNEKLSDKLLIVMRAYVEKPRTNIGWKGLAYDPQRDGRGNMEQGLQRSRQLMIDLAKLGLPLATEALNPLTMLYLDDLVSWTAIGARTAESQTHREMVSHLPMPVGIKNGTDGSASTAVNAMISARHSHHTLGLDVDGQIAMLDTPGNPDTHLVLRGGKALDGTALTNYDASSIAESLTTLAAGGVNAKVMVDCSHDNAEKRHLRQIDIAKQVVAQRAGSAEGKGQGNKGIVGLMLESFIEEGKQGMDGEGGDGQLTYGKSITDACISWNQTEELLNELHQMM